MNTAPNNQPAPEAGKKPPIKAAAAPEKKQKRTNAYLNQEQQALVEKTKYICYQAQIPGHTASLTAKGIPPEFITDLLRDCLAASSRGGEAANHAGNRSAATTTGKTLRRTLLASLRDLQDAARQEHQQTAPDKLRAYLIGQKINASREVLADSAQVILQKTGQERPSDVDTTLLIRVQDELTAFTGTKVAQTNEAGLARGLLAQRNRLVKSIQSRCQQVQMAANRAWPHTNADNAGFRGKFRLPARRSYQPKTLK